MASEVLATRKDLLALRPGRACVALSGTYDGLLSPMILGLYSPTQTLLRKGGGEAECFNEGGVSFERNPSQPFWNNTTSWPHHLFFLSRLAHHPRYILTSTRTRNASNFIKTEVFYEGTYYHWDQIN